MKWPNPKRNVDVTTEELLQAFSSLDSSNPSSCDTFFEDFGPGNLTSPNNPLLHIIDRPMERLLIYEHILLELIVADTNKYQTAHKGTPFYFISWLAFTVKDFEKAIFYMDAAVGEDIRKCSNTDPDAWKQAPGARFLFLDPNPPGPIAKAITAQLTKQFEEQINKFNQDLGTNLTLDQFRENFVTPNLNNPSYRSIISGLYVYVSEYAERTYQLRLRSNTGGSIEPFIVHLFKGGLIFESLLKSQYGGSGRSTLGLYLGQQAAKNDLEIGQNQTPLYSRDQPRPDGYTLPLIISFLPQWRTENIKEKIIAVAYAVRNTTGHDLSWPVSFDEVTYQEIYESIFDAILWFIWKVKM